MKQINGEDTFLFGVVKGTNTRIYMSRPSWDCGWYWSYGYLGNSHCHYHLEGYQAKAGFGEKRNICMYDALLEDYDLVPQIKENLWQFCEQAKTIYTLKEAAEVMGRGGSHVSAHKEREFILEHCKEHSEHLNDVVLPKLLQVFWDTFSKHESQENSED